MDNVEVGKRIVDQHLGEMNAMSRRKWPKIRERKGYRIISDRPYQGFDNDGSGPAIPELWPEPRFWCRWITVERVSDGRTGYGVGPQHDAYDQAIRRIENEG